MILPISGNRINYDTTFKPVYETRDLKPIIHYAFGLRFGNVCEHKREKNVRKTQMARVYNQRIV